MLINKQRLPVVIGKNGETKKTIEKLTRTRIEIDSESGEVTILPREMLPDQEEPPAAEDMEAVEEKLITPEDEIEAKIENLGTFNVWIAENIIRAINRGFNPQKAFKLLSDEYMLEIIDLEAILGRSEKAITRVKGRIIGESGKIRSVIEQYTTSNVSVFGNTIAIIGQYDDIRVARKAIQMLIQGAPHKTVTAFLEKKYKEKKDEDTRKLWKPDFSE